MRAAHFLLLLRFLYILKDAGAVATGVTCLPRSSA